MHIFFEISVSGFRRFFFFGQQASERIRTHPNVSEHVEKLPKTSKTSRKLREKFANFAKACFFGGHDGTTGTR